MSCCKEPYCDFPKTLRLIGSQVNLTPRSTKAVLAFDNSNNRPSSAVPSCRFKTEYKTKCIRPKSADCTSLNPFSSSESSSLTLSHFTDSSSKFLQNLIKTSTPETSKIEDNGFYSDSFFRAAADQELRNAVVEKEAQSKHEIFIIGLSDDSKLQKTFQEDNAGGKKHSNLKNALVQPEFSDLSEKKTVRFLEKQQLDLFYEKKFCHPVKNASYMDNENCSPCLKTEIKALGQEIHTPKTFEKSNILKLEPQMIDTDGKSESNESRSFCFDNEIKSPKFKKENEEEKFCEQCKNSPKDNKMSEKSEKNNKLSTFQTNLKVHNVEKENKFQKFQSVVKLTSEEEIDKNAKDTSNDFHQKIDISDSTYEEIVHLLRALDEDDSESLSSENKEEAAGTTATSGCAKEKIDYLSAVSSYLEEIEKDSMHENYSNAEKWSSPSFASPRLEELLSKNSVELAHEVFSLKIQIEEQKKGIKLLRNTLAEYKEDKKVEELEHQEALHKVTSEAETLVQRHQKFIKQLLHEKKNLNETVSKLIQDLKSGEERYKRNIKAMEEKHLVEIKRAKEAQMVADKIKREKWMENKTQKIKELTVKGLEPELSRMAVRQQEEITELRNLHKAELEAIELRAARRNSELMDELRAELTKEKERAIAKETAALRAAMAKDFEDEKNTLQQYCQNLKERVRKQEEKLSNQELEFQQRLIDYKQEEERKKQKMIRDHQDSLEEIQRRNLIELRDLKESLEAEKEVFINNYKKQQATKNLEREAELHQQYKRERDKEIELVIETFEKESAKIQSDLNNANEGKLKRLKDKMEAEIKEIEASETALKVKLSEAKAKLSEKEDVITELTSQIRQLQTELTFVKKLCEEMSTEKSKLKEVIREEFENSLNVLLREKENLEKEIVNLKEFHLKELTKKDQQNLQARYEMQKELTRVYSRIKTAVNKKEKIIESLKEENETINQRCCQLEIMLDQQRRNLLL